MSPYKVLRFFGLTSKNIKKNCFRISSIARLRDKNGTCRFPKQFPKQLSNVLSYSLLLIFNMIQSKEFEVEENTINAL